MENLEKNFEKMSGNPINSQLYVKLVFIGVFYIIDMLMKSSHFQIRYFHSTKKGFKFLYNNLYRDFYYVYSFFV